MTERIEPLPSALGGNRPLQVARRYWFAMRPAFFPASVLPVVVGTAWGSGLSGQLDLPIALLALFATVLVHASANVLNDVADDAGTDRANHDRIFPYTGGSRFIQNAVLTRNEMSAWGIGLLLAALAIGLVLLLLKGKLVLAFGLVGASLGVLYSLPPLQLAGRGVGELTIAIAFGVIPVVGAAWLQSGVLDLDAVLISLPVAAWVAAILLINEVPDVVADAAGGKRTLPVRLGIPATRAIYAALHFLAFLAIVAAVVREQISAFALLVPLGLLPFALVNARGIQPVREARAQLTRSIERTLLIHTLGCLWLAGWAWIGASAFTR